MTLVPGIVTIAIVAIIASGALVPGMVSIAIVAMIASGAMIVSVAVNISMFPLSLKYIRGLMCLEQQWK